jgi:hypothetical protein
MINIHDRIKQTSYTIGIGNFALGSVVPGYSTFSSVYPNSGSLFYCATDGTRYEIGSGIYLSSSDQIIRFPIKSTNNNSLVNFPEGLKEVFVTYPATNSIFNTSGIYSVPKSSGLSFWTSTNSLSYTDKIIIDSGNGRIGINTSNPSSSLHVGGPSSSSNIRASGFIVGNSGVYFPSGNNGTSSYSGGVQLVHFTPNQLDINSSTVLQLSGIVNQNILLKKQNSNMIFAGPSGYCDPPCGPDYPLFRFLVEEDIPDLNNLYYNVSKGATLSGIIYSVSGNLSSRITAVGSIISSASGSLNSRITSVSGYLDNKINNIANTIASSDNSIWNARLSLSSIDSIFSGSGTSLHLTPHLGNAISLYNGSSWQTLQITSKLVTNFSSLSPNTIYDIFGYLNNNDINFELTPWIMHNPPSEENPEGNSGNSYRSINLSKIDGVYCKSGNNTKRYIGTIKTTSSGFIDNPSSRLIYNQYNKVNKVVSSSIDDPNLTFQWIYTGPVRYIPYIPPIELINGLDSYADLSVVIDVLISYTRAETILGIIRRPEVYYHVPSDTYDDILYYIDNDSYFDSYAGIILSGIDGFVSTDIIGGDYQDGLRKTAKASIYCKPSGYETYYAIEKTIIGTPIYFGNKLTGNYGIIGTYQC